MLQTHILKQTCEDHFQCSKAPQIPCGQKDKRNMRNIFQRQLQGMGFGDCTAPLSHEKMKIQELSYRAVTLSFLDNKQHLLKMLLLLICNSMSVNDSFQARVVNSKKRAINFTLCNDYELDNIITKQVIAYQRSRVLITLSRITV